MSNVNSVVELLGDAQNTSFDTAIIRSGDRDQRKAMQGVQPRYPEKCLITAFPSDRESVQLRNVVNAWIRIGRTTPNDSQLPNQITIADCFVLARPRGLALRSI